MKLLYLTSKRYPATTADHFFVKSMAKAFSQILGKYFSLFIVGKKSEELEEINVVSVDSPRRFRIGFYFFWIPIFVFKSGNNNPSTVFFSNDPYLLTLLIFWKKSLGLKYLVCSDWHQLFNDWRDKYIAQNSDFLIATSKRLKNLIVKIAQINEAKVLVAYGGVDIDNFKFSISNSQKFKEELGFSGSDFLVGYVGFYKTMGMSKGVDTMISALALIPDPQVKMVLVGGKKEEIEYYKGQAEILGVRDRVIFVGVVPNSQIPIYESMMDVLVIPYPNTPHFRDYGFPMKVYEYMASGRPIVYSDLEIISEVLGDCGKSFKAGDSADLALKTKAIYEDKTMGEKMAILARDKVENYSWQKRAEQIKSFLESALRTKG